jgi:hypothetical protein
MSGRAWILFLCLSSMVSGVGFAVTPVESGDAGGGASTTRQVRVALDIQNQSCQLLWVGGSQ